jgi:hypothetical protein
MTAPMSPASPAGTPALPAETRIEHADLDDAWFRPAPARPTLAPRARPSSPPLDPLGEDALENAWFR